MIFVKKTDTLTVKLTVAKSKSKDWVLVDENEEAIKKVSGDDAIEIQNHEVTFRVPSFGDTNTIYDAAISTSETGVNLNPQKFREVRFKQLLVDWSFKDEEGKAVEKSKENVDSLHPLVAAFINIQLDKLLGDRGL